MSTFQLSPIKAIELAAANIPDSISLAQGIPSFNTPKPIIDFVIERIREGRCDKYSLTTGLRELREEIALALEKDNLRYDPESEILVTAGSIEGITASVLSCTSPGDEVIVPSPTYASYLGAIRLARAVPSYVPLDEEHNFDFHVEAIEQAITKRTRALLYCAPNNPTGTMYSESKTRRMLELAEKHNLVVIVDEVYKDFYYGNQKHFSPASIEGARSRVIRVCSFSKAYAMTGWRVAFLHTTKEHLASILKFHDAMVTCAPVVSQYAAIGAIRYGDSFLEEFRQEYRRRRDYSISRLERLSHVFDYQLPQATYFVFPRIKDTIALARDSKALAYDILNKVKVAVVPGIAFGPSGESHLRINFGREKHELERGFDRLEEYFQGNVKQVSTLSFGTSTPAIPSLSKTITRFALRTCASVRLMRKRPIIIGVVGFAGKTIFKRMLASLLADHLAVRAAPLSYNTDSGLPLAVLGINPTDFQLSRIELATRIALATFFEQEHAEALILEYGVRSDEDALLLSNIVKPDWIVLSGLEMEPGTYSQSALSGVQLLINQLPTQRVIWCKDDKVSSQLGLDPELAVSTEMLSGGALQLGTYSFTVQQETVGQYAILASAAASLLALKLGMPSEKINKFFSAQS